MINSSICEDPEEKTRKAQYRSFARKYAEAMVDALKDPKDGIAKYHGVIYGNAEEMNNKTRPSRKDGI